MPQVSIICPHCNARAEILVTGVARTRPCPACGQTLMLQVAEKNSGSKRRALLMAEVPPTDAAEAAVAEVRQRQFSGQPLEAMKADPEVMLAKRRLLTGLSVVAALIAVAIVSSVFTGAPVGKEGGDKDLETNDLVVEERPVPAKPVVKTPAASLDFAQRVKLRKSALGVGASTDGGN